MIHKAKRCALGIVLSFALLGSVASGASAGQFHSEKASTTISGSQGLSQKFSFDPGTVTCSFLTLSGSTTSATSSETTLTPSYSECSLKSIFGTISVSVNFNECDYRLDSFEFLRIECPAGKSVSISGPGCSITIPGFQTINAMTYWNTGSGSNRRIEAEMWGGSITYSYTGFACGSGNNTVNGTNSGRFLLKGSSGGGSSVGIWWE